MSKEQIIIFILQNDPIFLLWGAHLAPQSKFLTYKFLSLCWPVTHAEI